MGAIPEEVYKAMGRLHSSLSEGAGLGDAADEFEAAAEDAFPLAPSDKSIRWVSPLHSGAENPNPSHMCRGPHHLCSSDIQADLVRWEAEAHQHRPHGRPSLPPSTCCCWGESVRT